jgi:hypothetical protein
MKTTRLARRLGLDGNPLRRRSDKIAAYLAALLVAVFLIGAPLLSVAAVGWTGRAEATGQQTERSWHQVRAGNIPVSTALAAGHRVPLLADAVGSPAGPPPKHHAMMPDKAAAAAVATGALGIVLMCLAWAGRWMLGRRRLAGWEVEWAAVGPQWTKRFRSRG